MDYTVYYILHIFRHAIQGSNKGMKRQALPR